MQDANEIVTANTTGEGTARRVGTQAVLLYFKPDFKSSCAAVRGFVIYTRTWKMRFGCNRTSFLYGVQWRLSMWCSSVFIIHS